MPALRNAITVCALIAGCSTGGADTAPTAASTVPATVTTRLQSPTTTPPTTVAATTTAPRAKFYVFPFTGRKVSYGHRHGQYPATDVFGCGATVVAPTGGTIDEARAVDPWIPEIDDPATRGGKFVALVGDDGVRYYFAHLASVDVKSGDLVDPGSLLGVMGETGNARKSVCHTHFGISWPCESAEWAVRRGEVSPWKYLDAWRAGKQLSPVDEVAATEAANPDVCDLAVETTNAGDE